MRCWQITAVSGVALGTLGAGAMAQSGAASRVVTRADGTWRVAGARPVSGAHGTAGSTDALLWTWNEAAAVAASVGLAPSTGKAWVGQTQNAEKLQRFAITGPGTPEIEFPAGAESPSLVSSAQGADLAVFVDRNASGDPFVVRGYTANGATHLWEQGDLAGGSDGVSNIKVSRDGSTVAVALYSSATQQSTLSILDGATGAVRQTWTSAVQTQVGSVDLTDTGDLVLVNIWGAGPNAIVLNTSDMSQVFAANGTGSGGQMQISGNGDVITVGGFSFQVYKRTAGVYNLVINFNAPTSWFGWGSDVSRDGSTAAVFSHDYASGYLNTAVRIWDVNSATLLGTQQFTSTGTLQNSIAGGVLSDDGAVFAAASWGSQDNANPEVMVFNRQVQQIGSVDTVGSPFAIDLSGNGRYVLVGTKGVHANTFGAGGDTYLFDTGVGGGGCYPNCDGSTTAPILNVLDFNCFVNAFGAGDSYANCDGSTTAPVLNVLDFNCFVNAFSAGCP